MRQDMRYIIGFLFVFGLIIYVSIGAMSSVDKPKRPDVVAESQYIEIKDIDTPVKKENLEPVRYNNEQKTVVVKETKQVVETRSQPTRKLVGGAEVEWIEPDTSEQKTKFGLPPE